MKCLRNENQRTQHVEHWPNAVFILLLGHCERVLATLSSQTHMLLSYCTSGLRRIICFVLLLRQLLDYSTSNKEWQHDLFITWFVQRRFFSCFGYKTSDDRTIFEWIWIYVRESKYCAVQGTITESFQRDWVNPRLGHTLSPNIQTAKNCV
jgi:hypothetical protein